MHFKSTVFGLIFIAYLCECDALNPGDKGVCTVKQTVRTTVKRWYTAYKNPRCGRRCGIVKRSRPEVKLSSINHSVCCSGWIYNANEEICEAVCSQGCEGRCIAPDTCEPYICDPPCFNAHCAINGCQCNDNFTKYNDTHCHSCGPGYRINDQFTCSPICDKVCVNSECTAPNQCTCLEGYQNSDEFTCEPICENCVNSTCVAPNNCSCFEGFERVNKTVCAPPCVCDNGLCAMRICVCNEGFIQIDGVCQPFCEEECIDGFCSGFNVCSCFDGYEKNEASSNVCRRICQEECNGTCDDDGECFASCVKPSAKDQL